MSHLLLLCMSNYFYLMVAFYRQIYKVAIDSLLEITLAIALL